MEAISSWQYQRFHISYLIAWFACGTLAGLVLAFSVPLQLGIIGVVSGLLAMISALRSRRWWAVIVVVVFGMAVGLDRGTVVHSQLDMYQKFVGARVLVKGIIDDDPTYGSRGDQQFRLHDVIINKQKMRGEIFVTTNSILDVKRGDTLEVQGKLLNGFGNYQATLRFATLVKAEQARDPVREFRDRFAAGVRNVMPEPAASLGIGFVVGQRSALPDTLDEQLRVVGLTHIVVASGYNLTILVRFMRRLLARKSKYLATLSSTMLMISFVLVSGLSPSMTRASAVTGLSLLAWYYGRKFHPLMLILYVAAATAWWNPVFLWSDIGWYLSFLAFGGVLILAPLLAHLLYGKETPPALVQLVIETFAATIMTLPIILFIFGQLPVLSLLSNMLVAPIIPLAMLVTTLAGIGGIMLPSLLGIVGVVAGWVVGYVIAVVELLSSLPWAQLNVQIPAWVMVVAYSVVILGAAYAWLRTRYNFRATSVVD